jgi:uncharacterized membrane protein YdjX (TVP38/TMEM64 family)
VKWLVAALVIVGFVLLWWAGLLEQLSDTQWLQQQLENAGLLGPLLFILAVCLLFPLFMAGPLIWLSGTIWPVPMAILYSCIAALLGGLLFFLLARWLGQEWAERHIPEKVRKYEAKLEAYPTRTIIILRLVLWINPAVDILIGVSRVSTANYCLSSAVALIPCTAFHVVVSTLGIGFIAGVPGWVLGLIAAVIALLVLIAFLRRRV